MSIEKYYLSFGWKARKEDPSHCAKRMHQLLVHLKPIDVLFSSWRKIESHKKYKVPISLSILKKWLTNGVHRTDVGKELIPDLGFSDTFISTEGKAYLVLRIHCGDYSDSVNNVCAFEFPVEAAIAARLLQVPILSRICFATVNAWEPDHGIVSTYALSELVPANDFFAEVGWITYLSAKYGTVPQLPKPTRVEKVDHGSLIIATDERLSSNNPVHVRAVTKLAKALDLNTRLKRWYTPP